MSPDISYSKNCYICDRDWLWKLLFRFKCKTWDSRLVRENRSAFFLYRLPIGWPGVIW